MALWIDFISFFLHLDQYLIVIIKNYGVLTYAILFAIIFAETGLVIAPILPGDSLIFVSGAFASSGILNVYVLFVLFALAAILGDSFNYFVGKYFGKKISGWRFIKQDYILRTEDFYKEHGGKTIIFARFIPFVRTFAPFIAGIGKMNYKRFLTYNIFGGILWTAIFVFGGYFFGTIPIVRDNLTIAMLVIVLSSFIPPLIEFFRQRKNKRRNAREDAKVKIDTSYVNK